MLELPMRKEFGLVNIFHAISSYFTCQKKILISKTL